MEIISEDKFYEDFNMVKNHIDKNASFDGCMFETFGPEYEYIKKKFDETPHNVWTITDEDGKLYYNSGFRFVNRLGYFITKESTNGKEIIVEIEDVE